MIQATAYDKDAARKNGDFVQITTTLAAVKAMTPESLEAIQRLAQKPTVVKILLWLDMFNPEAGNLVFRLYGNRGPEDVFLTGLIQADGSVNT